MQRKNLFALALLIGGSVSISNLPAQQAVDQEPVALSDAIGPEIDQNEREAYGLFPDVRGFESATLYRGPDSGYRLEYSYRDATGTHRKSRKISSEALELTRLHVGLVEAYWSGRQAAPVDSVSEAEVLHRLTLRYAFQKRYDVAATLAEDLRQIYPTTRHAQWAQELSPRLQSLRKSKRALIWPGALLDQSGRTELLIFSGYYGLWLGVATPIALEADSPQAYALGLLLGGPLSVAVTHSLTKEANISKGRATMISLGGHLGTWQGLGWAAISDAEGSGVIGAGELAGLTGIGAATLLTSKVDFSEGHAAVTSSGLQWGAWFGAVFAALADHKDDEVLRDMLIGSDVLVLGAGIAARNVRMSETRVRLINLAGLIGTVFGFGINLLIEVEEASTAFTIAGLGSVAGLAIGTRITRNFDKGRELSFGNAPGSHLGFSPFRSEKPQGEILRKGASLWPYFGLEQNPANRQDVVPSVELRLNF